MKYNLLFILFVVLLAGCTSQLQAYTVQGAYQSVTTDYNLDVLVTDQFQLGTNTLFSNEMTRLVLNVINLAQVPFKNVRAVVINADDLNPVTTEDYFEEIDTNKSEIFEWDLTAPRLGLGEALYLNNIKVRMYYDTYAETTKTLLLKSPGDRVYESTASYSSQSPVAVSFDTSFETITTLADAVKNFTVNLLFFNNYSGTIDYYDNIDISDNYVRRIIIGVDPILKFYNVLDINTPWEKVTDTYSDQQLEEIGLTRSDLDFKDYYILSFKTLNDVGITVCSLQSGEDGTITAKSNMLTEQRRMLWMTRGTTKVNVLRFGAESVNSTTEIELTARIDYSYSQDFGGENFGVVVYGLG